MVTVSVSETVNAPLDWLWDSWDDFGAIDRFNPNLQKSFLINQSAETGLGAQRQCDLADGKNYIQEKVVEYVPQKRMVVDIYNGTLPLKYAVARLEYRSLGTAGSEVTMTMDFEPKFGLLGKLMVPMMKPKFRGMLGALLKANKAFVEHGTEVRSGSAVSGKTAAA